MSKKGPPVLKEDGDYQAWKKEIQAWEIITELEPEKRGISIFLNGLEGVFKDIVSKLNLDTLNNKAGVNSIFKVLDRYCQSTEAHRAYTAFEKVHKFRRSPEQSISEALLSFDSLILDLFKCNIELPTTVLAYLVLNAMDIGESNMKMARATVAKLTYEDMVEKVKAIMDTQTNTGVMVGFKGDSDVKEEADTLYARGQSWQRRGRASRGFRSRGFRVGRNSQSSMNTVRKCFTCGSPDHLSYDCPYRQEMNNNRNFQSGASGRNFQSRMSTNSMNRCFKCQAEDHFAYACPNSNSFGGEQPGTVNIVLLQSSSKSVTNQQFIGDTFGYAVIDSGAKSNVAGKVWVDSFLESLSEDELKEVSEERYVAKYRFGDGEEVLSDVKIKLPVVIGGVKQSLTTSIVNKELPLLLSFESLNRNRAIIDFGNLVMKVGNNSISLKRTSESGHLLLSLLPVTSNTRFILHVRDLENLSYKDKEKKMLKLHKQMSHASKESLIRLLASSGLKDKGLQEAVCSVTGNCSVCQKYKKKPSRPCVAESLSEGFNCTVAIDLKTYIKDKVYIIHLICLGTRYSVAGVIYSKTAEVIVRNILKLWVMYFGPPRRLLSDNGGEFNNFQVRELCEKFNIQYLSTPGESPWSNGVCERHNAILMEATMKTMDECHCSIEAALPWAVSAKNCLSNVSGFSPNMLVFGRNPNSPTVLTDLVPALSSCSESDIVRNNLQLMHVARKSFVEAESSEKIRRALRMKLRTSNDLIVENGDNVYYRRENVNGWKGPGTVIGRDGKLVIVRHGGIIYRVPLCHIMPVSKANKLVSESQEEGSDSKANKLVSESKEEESDSEENRPRQEDTKTQEDAGEVESETESIDIENTNVGVQSGSKLPKVSSTVKFKEKEGGNWRTAMVISKGGKVTGKNKNYVNIQVEGEELPKGVHWDKYVDVWKESEALENVVFFTKTEELSEKVIEAKEVELENWKSNKVYERVKDVGQKRISSRWVITEKGMPGDEDYKLKTRLVCRGYEENSESLRTDSPTLTKESMRLLSCIAMSRGWTCKSLDVRAAFLQGFEIDREIFMKPPSDAEEEGVLWKLLRCPYGLNDAPRAWFKRVRYEFLKLGAVSSRYDEACFYFKKENKLEGMIVIFVDDFYYSGGRVFSREFIDKLVQVFKVRVQNCGNFKYLGLNIIQAGDHIQVDQSVYIQNLECISISSARSQSTDSPLTSQEKKEVKSKCGQLLWVANYSRPDISCETSMLCNPGKDAVVRNILDVNKVVMKLKETRTVVRYPNLGKPEEWSLVVYSDSSYANLPDGYSQGGFIIFVSNNVGKVAPLCWQSKKIHRVARSTLAAETLSAVEAIDAALLLRNQINEILSVTPSVTLYTDCRSLHENVHTSKIVTDKSLRVSASYVRQLVNNGEIKVCWVDSHHQLADSLTKSGTSGRYLREVLTSCYL